uniref:Uncharacterized protein n=1 Tax=Ciona savignyi TaxID=51511 RepID=H2ZDX7_CIOSA
MNFNSDLSKSYPFYPIPGLSELSEESGHPSSNVNHPLHHTTRHEAATRILNTPDAAFVSQIVDAFSATPNEHLNPAQQSGCIDGINPSPLLQAVLAPNPYDHRNTTMGLPAHMPPMNLLP